MSKTTRADVLPLIVAMAEEGSMSGVWAKATGFFAAIGFARCNYGYTRFLHGRSIGDPNDALFLTTLDAEYTRRYFADGFFARTPVFRWAQRNSGACTWAWVRRALAEGRLTPEEMDALRQNAEMGVTAGISVSFPEQSSRSKGALGLIADPGLDEDAVERIWAAERDAILAVAHAMHLRIIQFPQPSSLRPLTDRQREALEWVADGKTAQDIALLMGISAAMVEKHLRLAREALNVETTAQAVAKGAIMNVIFQCRGAGAAPALQTTGPLLPAR